RVEERETRTATFHRGVQGAGDFPHLDPELLLERRAEVDAFDRPRARLDVSDDAVEDLRDPIRRRQRVPRLVVDRELLVVDEEEAHLVDERSERAGALLTDAGGAPERLTSGRSPTRSRAIGRARASTSCSVSRRIHSPFIQSSFLWS